MEFCWIRNTRFQSTSTSGGRGTVFPIPHCLFPNSSLPDGTLMHTLAAHGSFTYTLQLLAPDSLRHERVSFFLQGNYVMSSLPFSSFFTSQTWNGSFCTYHGVFHYVCKGDNVWAASQILQNFDFTFDFLLFHRLQKEDARLLKVTVPSQRERKGKRKHHSL